MSKIVLSGISCPADTLPLIAADDYAGRALVLESN